jgi:hypothetical protein
MFKICFNANGTTISFFTVDIPNMAFMLGMIFGTEIDIHKILDGAYSLNDGEVFDFETSNHAFSNCYIVKTEG